jgi:cytochrome P450
MAPGGQVFTIHVVGVRRKTIAPFTFSDGTHVPKGNWVCIPEHAIQHDPEYYSDPYSFNGFRFVPPDRNAEMKTEQANHRVLTDIEFTLPMWGMGKSAWWVQSSL